MPTPFPDARSLFGAMATLDRTLADFETARATQTFVRNSSDDKVRATANGLGFLVSVFIDASQLALTRQALADKVRGVVNAALDAADAAGATAATTLANTLALPGLPARGA